MRLLWISFVAIVALTTSTGCSSSRYRQNLIGNKNDSASSLSDEHQYEPRTERSSEDEFRNPPREPAPAPPATGVSRVKSVSLLKDLSDKLHGRKNGCTSDCVDDSKLVGKCSPVEPCTPTPEQSERVHRYVDRYYCESNSQRLNPLRSLKKSLHRAFHHQPAKPCGSECSEIVSEPGCEVPTDVCRAPALKTRRLGESCSSCITETAPVPKLQKRSSDCLADPMEGSELTNEPGLISPEDQISIDEIPSLSAPEKTQPGPSLPTTDDVPATVPEATPPIPAQPVPPAPTTKPLVEDVPTPPESSQVVEPPVWPRLQGPNKQVSMPNGSGIRRHASPMIIQPRPDK